MPDETLRQFCTDRQWKVLEALDGRSQKQAADFLGCTKKAIWASKDAVMRKAAKHGYSPEHDLTHPVAPGQRLSGASTLYDLQTGEAKIQWVKTQADKEQQDELFRESIAAMASDLPKVKATPAPKTNHDLLAVYPVGDHHFGQLSWSEETGGEDYDLAIAEEVLSGAMKHLVASSPGCAEAAILILGDFMHYDSFQPVTPQNKNLLDSDSRFPKMVRVAIRAIRTLIRDALKKHTSVRLIIEIGNHDMASAVFLMECFAVLYDLEPRVTVDNSPRQFHAFVFGKNMIGTHHGHSVKMDRLPLMFAADWPREWGDTLHRVIHTGHVHHDHRKEFQGLIVESHGILAPNDAYAANAGYRSSQRMKSIVYHRDHGEVARHTVSPEMLRAE